MAQLYLITITIDHNPGWIYELEQQTDNDNEPDSDLQHLWTRI